MMYTGKLHLIDLAGSEDNRRTGNTGFLSFSSSLSLSLSLFSFSFLFSLFLLLFCGVIGFLFFSQESD